MSSEEKKSVDKYFELVANEAKLFHEINTLKEINNDLRTRIAQSVDEKIHLERVNELKKKLELAIRALKHPCACMTIGNRKCFHKETIELIKTKGENR